MTIADALHKNYARLERHLLQLLQRPNAEFVAGAAYK
jgi:hypothetical protein